MDPQAFRDLIKQVRAGDAEAAANLVRAFEPELRRFVRIRLTDPKLRRVLDSMDVCQSVLGGFFVRVAAGQFDLEEPEHLLKLLAVMIRNKVRDYVRHGQAQCRDQRRQEPELYEGAAVERQTPSRILAGRELLEKVRRQLSPDEQRLFEQRAQGRSWDELAAEVGEPVERLRKRYSRAVQRVADQLGLEEGV
jgi:RNA polymerase sigma-70 factor (ECF subfamily)